MSSQVVDLKASVSKHKRSDKDLVVSTKAIAGVLTPDSQSVVLNDQFTELLIQIMKRRVENGVTIATVIPHKNQGVSAVTEVSRIKESVPGTKVSSIRLNLKGAYGTYDGLMAYIKELRQLPVSVVNLKVEGNNFELGIRVYGN